MKHSSLYEQIGGQPAVEAVVDNFYERVWGDPALQRYFVGVDRASLKRHQRVFLRFALGGGPYEGHSLARAHAGLSITGEAFDSVAEHLFATLSELKVDRHAVTIIGGALEGFRPSVVGVAA